MRTTGLAGVMALGAVLALFGATCPVACAQEATDSFALSVTHNTGDTDTVVWGDTGTFTDIPTGATAQFWGFLYIEWTTAAGVALGSTQIDYATATANNAFTSISEGSQLTFSNTKTTATRYSTLVAQYRKKYNSKTAYPPAGEYFYRYRIRRYYNIEADGVPYSGVADCWGSTVLYTVIQ